MWVFLEWGQAVQKGYTPWVKSDNREECDFQGCRCVIFEKLTNLCVCVCVCVCVFRWFGQSSRFPSEDARETFILNPQIQNSLSSGTWYVKSYYIFYFVVVHWAFKCNVSKVLLQCKGINPCELSHSLWSFAALNPPCLFWNI